MPLTRRLLLAACTMLLTAATAQAAARHVAITAIVEHPALDACRQGILAALKQSGLEVTTTFANAQGSPATAAQIARKLVGESPDVIVPITTPSAQAVVAATKDIPVVFTAVTDPLGAKLVGNLEHPGGNVTGMADLSPVAKHLDLIREIMPAAHRLGMIYNPGEANAVTLLKLAQKEAPTRQLEIVPAAAPQSSAVQSAARSLVGKVDAIYVPTDNTVVTALEAILKVGTENRLPVFAGDSDSVRRGAIATFGLDYFDVGRQTGAIVVRVLEGDKPADIPVEGVTLAKLVVNPKAAMSMGLTLPAELVQRADEVVP